MSEQFDSFDESPFGAFIESVFHVRGNVSNLVFTGDYLSSMNEFDIQNIGFFDKSINSLVKIGQNRNWNGTPQYITSFKKILYVFGADRYGTTQLPDDAARYEPETGEFVEMTPDEGGYEARDSVVYLGQLVLVGSFQALAPSTTRDFIVRWTGTSFIDWPNDSLEPGNLNTGIKQTTLYDGELIITAISGWFGIDTPAQFDTILKWNETLSAWKNLIPGGSEPFDYDNAFIVNSAGLLWSGSFDQWTWNGGAFTKVFDGSRFTGGGSIFDRCIFDGSIVIIGTFLEIDGNLVNGVAIYDSDTDTWFPIGTGIDTTTGIGLMACHVDNKLLYLNGDYELNGEGEALEGLIFFNKGENKFENVGNRDNYNLPSQPNKYRSMTSNQGKMTIPE